MESWFTAESVTSGHPDKVCDQISDALLDAHLKQDPHSRVAIEAFGSKGLLVVGGEITSQANINVAPLVRKLYKDIGYDDRPRLILNLNRQSPEIAQGVDLGGAGDQGIMYGYATDETPERLPLPVVLSHRLTAGLEDLRRNHSNFSWLRPDGKSQVTAIGKKVKTVLVSCQHDPLFSLKTLRHLVTKNLIRPIFGRGDYQIIINPNGTFGQGGFTADTGLTGRKIMVDTYGGLIPHGGGAFSGKDPTKVDRSAAYMARFVAKNVIDNGYAKKCLISLAYALGRPEPLMIEVETFGTGDRKEIKKIIEKKFDFSPKGIIEKLELRRPIYLATASYGHFGRKNFPWEKSVSL